MFASSHTLSRLQVCLAPKLQLQHMGSWCCIRQRSHDSLQQSTSIAQASNHTANAAECVQCHGDEITGLLQICLKMSALQSCMFSKDVAYSSTMCTTAGAFCHPIAWRLHTNHAAAKAKGQIGAHPCSLHGMCTNLALLLLLLLHVLHIVCSCQAIGRQKAINNDGGYTVSLMLC